MCGLLILPCSHHFYDLPCSHHFYDLPCSHHFYDLPCSHHFYDLPRSHSLRDYLQMSHLRAFDTVFEFVYRAYHDHFFTVPSRRSQISSIHCQPGELLLQYDSVAIIELMCFFSMSSVHTQFTLRK